MSERKCIFCKESDLVEKSENNSLKFYESGELYSSVLYAYKVRQFNKQLNEYPLLELPEIPNSDTCYHYSCQRRFKNINSKAKKNTKNI